MKTNRLKIIIIYLFFLIFISSGAYTAQEGEEKVSQFNPFFVVEALNFPGEQKGNSNLTLYIGVYNDKLQFIKDGEGYAARYELSVVVANKDGNQVGGEVWTKRLWVQNYDQTNSRKDYNVSTKCMTLPWGNYNLTLRLMDKETDINHTMSFPVKLRDFGSKKISVSDILFFSNEQGSLINTRDEIKKSLFGVTRDLTKNFSGYVEVYREQALGEPEGEYFVKSKQGDLVLKGNLKFEKISDFIIKSIFEIDKQKLNSGIYTVSVKVKAGDNTDEIEESINIAEELMLDIVDNLDNAISEMKYILTRDEIKEFDKAAGELRKKKFLEYWKKIDPSPNTVENELMREYFRRVNYSNEHFTTDKEGWRTDRGMIYIKFGEPDEIEQYPYELHSRSYEVWQYYRLGRKYTFLDEKGDGNFILVRNPVDNF